jgi:hypothetical protein
MEIQQKTKAVMEFVLEEACRHQPNGGNHEMRKIIAERLAKAAGRGETEPGVLQMVARHALAELKTPRAS